MELGEEYDSLLFYSHIRWISRGKFLERLFNLKDSVYEFLKDIQKKGDLAARFYNIETLQALAYLSDIFNKLNILNLSIQGKNHNLINMTNNINAFSTKLVNYKKSIGNNIFSSFPTLHNNFYTISIRDQIFRHLSNLEESFKTYFPHLKEFDTTLCNNPFNKNYEDLENFLQDEFIELKNNSDFKKIFDEVTIEQFWVLIQHKYQLIGEWVLRFLVQFSSTYLCESGFSHLVYLKNKYRNKLEVKYQLILAISSIKPRIKYCVENFKKVQEERKKYVDELSESESDSE